MEVLSSASWLWSETRAYMAALLSFAFRRFTLIPGIVASFLHP